ncbi:hypothetical protein [Rhodonellum sp.]|uniref:hypothetical protein n=1 Tax=Rhodonellum sp. TaxID=2231180 RepID=UPI002722D121|nr:hypothetical protein [Rhodonellum sp.]MDO9554229.1 hypothetical protein [Rhodonellum sp.]
MKKKLKDKKILLPLIALLFIFFSCENNELDNNIRPLLNEKFNGKYEILSSISKAAVDLNNDGIESTNLLDENSMILFSTIEIRIPYKDERFFTEKEFVFLEFWPTENEQRLKTNEIITVYNTRFYNFYYDLYGNTLIGEFKDDLSSATFRKNITDDGKNTLIELKSIEILEDETIKVTVVRKLYTMNGWITAEIESLYKRFTPTT